jgi:hypothetical protein
VETDFDWKLHLCCLSDGHVEDHFPGTAPHRIQADLNSSIPAKIM